MSQPRFADIQHPQLAPDWIKEGLDEIYDRVGADIRHVGFDFWVTNHYNDNNNFQVKAGFYASLSSPDTEANERRLDAIPSMRRLERNAGKLWHLLPLSYDDEANILGETTFIIEPGKIEFTISDECDDDLNLVRMVAEYKNGTWECYDEITVYVDISETLRATPTGERLAEAIDLTSIGFSEGANKVKVISGEIDDDNAIVLRFEPGLFTHFNAAGERD